MSRYRVLYIEDNAKQRQGVARRLRNRGFLVTTAKTGEEGLRRFDQIDPDAVLCDLNMPRTDGLEVLRRIKSLDETTPVIILTAHGSIDQARQAIREGAYHFILKPVELHDLEITIHQAVEHEAMQARLSRHSRELEQMVAERTERLQFANRQLTALNVVARQFAEMRDEEELLESVPDLMAKVLDFDRAFLFMKEEGRLKLKSLRWLHDPPELIHRFKERISEPGFRPPQPVLDCIEHDRTEFIPDLNLDKRWPKDPGQIIRTKALVLTPVRVWGDVVGMIIGNMQHHDREMDEQDVARVEMYAQLVGKALESTRAYRDLEATVKERTTDLRAANRKLEEKARSLEHSQVELARANIDLLRIQEELQEKNDEMNRLVTALENQRDVLQILIDSSPTAIIMTDSDDSIIVTNRAATDFFGIDAAELLGQKIDVFHSRAGSRLVNRERYGKLISQLSIASDSMGKDMLTPSHMFERALETREPEHRFLAAFSVAVETRDKEPLGRVWLFADITAIKRADEQLRTIIDASPIPTIVSRVSDGKIIYANSHLARLFGEDAKAVLGRLTPDFYANPEDRKEVLQMLHEHGSVDNHEVLVRRRDGSTFWALFSLNTTELDGEPMIIGGIYDISERIRFENQLQAERNFTNAILETTAALVVVLSPDGNVVRFNRAAERISGYSQEQLHGTPIWDLLIVEDERTKIRDRFDRITGSDVPIQGDNDWVCKNGTKRRISWWNSAMRDHEGKTQYIVATGVDITERTAAEQKLRQAHDQLTTRLRYEEGLAACSQALLSGGEDDSGIREALGYLLRAANCDRVYVFANEQDEEGELIARYLVEVVAENVSPWKGHHSPTFRYADGFQHWREELEAGRPMSGLLTDMPEMTQGIVGELPAESVLALPINVQGKWFGVLGLDDVDSPREWSKEDVRAFSTASEMLGIYFERQMVAKALQFSETRFRRLVENANDVIFSLDSRGTFTYLSPRFTDLTGYSTEAFIGRPPTELMHPEDAAAMPERLKSRITSLERWTSPEYRIIRPDGEKRWFVSNAQVIRDENENVREIIGIAHDITDLKQANVELERANHEIRKKQSQLVQSEKMASLGMLVAGIAHEINTPIGAVSSMHNTLVRATSRLDAIIEGLERGEKPPTGTADILKVIEDANRVIANGVERVTTIVRRLRSFARLDEAIIKTVDVHEGIEDTLTLIHHEIKHNVEIVRDYGELPRISCYPGQLNQVFLNLLNNARQAIVGKGSISIRTRSTGRTVEVSFSDTGIGIKPEQLHKVFDPGFTTKGVGVGTGLGLSICYQIIQDHRGDISVESELGKGTTFTIELPTDLEEQLEREGKQT